MDNDLDRALALIEQEEPLPLDLIASLIEQGIDVDQLIYIHSP